MPPIHSDLPIITPDPTPPRKSTAEKYGGLFYLSVAGLVVVIALTTYFARGVWALRDVWERIYVLNDPKRPEADRLQAAFDLARDERVSQRQRYDLAMSRVPPDLARYVLAESLDSSLVEDDPRAAALAVARSPGWPDWLRLLLTRRLAVAAGEGVSLPPEPLAELRKSADPAVALWAAFAQAAASPGDAEAARFLADASRADRPNRELATLLREALDSPQPDRNARLAAAARWLRQHHPAAVRLGAGRATGS